jgi:hypothetical protein
MENSDGDRRVEQSMGSVYYLSLALSLSLPPSTLLLPLPLLPTCSDIESLYLLFGSVRLWLGDDLQQMACSLLRNDAG